MQQDNMQVNNIIGKNIKSIRNSFHANEREFSSYLGVDEYTLAMFESGELIPYLDILEKLSDLCLYFNVDDIVNIKINPKKNIGTVIELINDKTNIISEDLNAISSVNKIYKSMLEMDGIMYTKGGAI